MTSNETAEILNELAALKKFFLNARQSLESGTITSMVGIDSRIAKVCQSVQQAKPDQQEKFLPELTVLIELLNGYEQGLRDFQAVQLAEAAKVAASSDD